MINAIIYNPYRILGIFSNSPRRELVANKSQIQAFLRVNKAMTFKLDLNSILTSIERTQTNVDYADSELSLLFGQIKHAQFWFLNQSRIDNIAFNYLYDGNIDTAIDIWKKCKNLSSLQNLFVSYLIKGDAQTAITDCAIPLYEQYSNDFVSLIDKNAVFSKEELIQNIIMTLDDAKVNLLKFASDLQNATWKDFILISKVEPLISNLNFQITEAKQSKNRPVDERLTAGMNLKTISKPILDSLREIITYKDIRYQLIADKVAQEVLQCSIDYYNGTKEINKPAKVLPLCAYALGIAIGNAAKQRCEENYKIIKAEYENMPPEEVANEVLEISNLIIWHNKLRHTSKLGLDLLKKTQKPIITIKETLGKNHAYYLETTSNLANAALNYVIEEVNEVQKDDAPDPFDSLLGNYSQYHLFNDIPGSKERRRQRAITIKKALRDAWQTILYIDLLDMTNDFKKNRYNANRNTLHSIISNLKGFDYPDDNYIIKGCAHGLTADRKFFWSDSEQYEDCKSKSDYNKYLQMFPIGNHVSEAKQKIEEIEAREKQVRKYILIAILIAVVLFIIIMASNAKNTSLHHSSTPDYNSGYYGNSRCSEYDEDDSDADAESDSDSDDYDENNDYEEDENDDYEF